MLRRRVNLQDLPQRHRGISGRIQGEFQETRCQWSVLRVLNESVLLNQFKVCVEQHVLVGLVLHKLPLDILRFLQQFTVSTGQGVGPEGSKYQVI